MGGASTRSVHLGLLLAAGLLAAGCGDDDHAGPKHDAVANADVVALADTMAAADQAAAEPEAPVATDAGGAAETGERLDAQSGGSDSEPGVDASTARDAGAGPDLPPSIPATIIVLPDTQYYSAAYPDVYAGQTGWIVSQIQPLRIDAVLHVGDIVDGFNSTAQWTAANAAMRTLDGLVPYLLVPGNHDTDGNRNTPINSYFGPASMPWIAGTMNAGLIENNYALLDIGPQRWLVLGLEFGPRDAVVAWADGVLKAFPDRPAILVTHAYLYHDGTRYDINVSPTQLYIPQTYNYTPSQGINDGEMLWQKLVLPNRNVRLVFSGHDTGWARLTSTRPDGSQVHQMLSDYQWLDGQNFGFGYLRIVQLDYGRKTIAVQTYSPYLQQYLTDDANQFTLGWNL